MPFFCSLSICSNVINISWDMTQGKLLWGLCPHAFTFFMFCILLSFYNLPILLTLTPKVKYSWLWTINILCHTPCWISFFKNFYPFHCFSCFSWLGPHFILISHVQLFIKICKHSLFARIVYLIQFLSLGGLFRQQGTMNETTLHWVCLLCRDGRVRRYFFGPWRKWVGM